MEPVFRTLEIAATVAVRAAGTAMPEAMTSMLHEVQGQYPHPERARRTAGRH